MTTDDTATAAPTAETFSQAVRRLAQQLADGTITRTEFDTEIEIARNRPRRRKKQQRDRASTERDRYLRATLRRL